MKPKHLVKDYKFIEQELGTTTHGKNGVRNANTNAIQNEKGFRVSSANIPYDINGIIETDSDPIIFSTNNTYSAFGFFNEATDTYTPIVDDQFKSYKLGFRKDKYIKGEARRNYKNNIEIAWLDKFNPVRFADTSNPPEDLSNYLIFPEFSAPTLTLDVVNGGTLPMGSYFVAVKYLNPDGTETRYTTPSTPVFAVAQNFGAIPGASTGKALKIQITNIDPRYKSIQVAIIKRINGVTTVVELPEQTATGTANILYTGSEGDDITLEEVLIPSAFYNNAGSITQLNDVLYMADMKEADVLNLQMYALMATMKWQSQYRDNIESDDDIKSGELRTFKHGEVYAYFLSYVFKNGQETDGFITLGPAPTGTDGDPDSAATTEGFSARKYQTNTVGMTSINTVDKTGTTGVWVNQNENYPDLPEFDATSIGGQNLRGQPVRHHKMPTLNQTRSLFYSSIANFGVKGLDVLGITADNIIIPPSLHNEIIGYKIYYARRDYSNATILSQGLTIYGAKSGYTGAEVYFTGGNYNARMLRSDFSHTDGNRAFVLTNKVFKLHHPDLMVNRPAIAPTFLASNYRLSTAIPSAVRNTNDELNFMTDYVTNGSVVDSAYAFKGVKDTGYLPVNGSKGVIKNIKSEDGLVGTFNNVAFTISQDQAIHGGRETEGSTKVPAYEQANLVDVVVVKSDMYTGFNTRELVRTDVQNSTDMTQPRKYSYSGDCFLVIHSYWGHGLCDSPDRFPTNPGRVDGITNDDEDTYTDEFYLGTSGIKVSRRYVTESVMNLWQRYVDPALPASKFYTASPIETMNGMDRNKDNNVIAISKDSASIGDLLNGIKTYDFDQVNITDSPYKIIRSNKQAKEGKLNSWKNYNALDYFEADKNMGPIMNLQGYDDRLIIHHRNALFITQDKTTLQGDILSVTLGTGDIFRMPPRQGKASKLGLGGTQHQLACMLTDFGYIFPDAEMGIWYVLNEQGLMEMNVDLYNFFKEYLNIPEINPFIGNGICVGYDGDLKRVLITVKNQALIEPENYVPNYEETSEFFAKLEAGVSIVFKDGRYQRFLGENTSEFSCPNYPSPVLGDYEFTIPEDEPVGTLVGTVETAGGTAPYSYIIMSGNDNGAFTIDSISGKIVVANQVALDVLIQDTFNLVIKAIDSKGNSDTGAVVVNLTAVLKAPITQDYELEVDENLANDTLLQMVAGTDPKGLTLTWSIESQTVAGAVKVNSSTGALAVNDTGDFDFETNPILEAVIRVANPSLYALSTVRIILRNLNEAPEVEGSEFTIPIAYTGVVGTYNLPTDPDPDDTITVTVISQSTPDAFLVNTSNRDITVNPDHALLMAEQPYTINLRAIDDGDPTQHSDFVVTINVTSPTAWRVKEDTFFCVLDEAGDKTGYKGWSTLEEYNTDDDTTTGETKDNDEEDVDYVAPVLDEETCNNTITAMWIGDPETAYCEEEIEEVQRIENFASPLLGFIADNNEMYCADASLDGVIHFNPGTIVDGSTASLISMGAGSRPTGSYYHKPTNRLFVNAFNGGGMKVIDCATNSIITTINYGSNGSFSRGNVFYMDELGEVWGIGNSGFVRVNPTTLVIIPNSPFSFGSTTGLIAVFNKNNKVYVFNDNATNTIKIYNATTGDLSSTITGFLQNTQDTGAYVSRGFYHDEVNNCLYLGEISTTGGVIVFDLSSDTITNRIAINKEGETYCGPLVIGFHPLRGAIYMGGSVYTNPSTDSHARLWLFDPIGLAITDTVTPSANTTINGITYYPLNKKVYVLSQGLNPQSSPNTGHAIDGIIFEFN